jgi:hypothetical protein
VRSDPRTVDGGDVGWFSEASARFSGYAIRLDTLSLADDLAIAVARRNGGPDRDRTGDLMNAIHARSQLRYWPTSER